MQSFEKYNHADGIKNTRSAFIAWLVILLIIFGLFFAGCKKENVDNYNQKAAQTTIKEAASVSQKPVSKLYEQNTCLKLSEILYESRLYQYRKGETAIPSQSVTACKAFLEKMPNNLEVKINLIGSRYMLPRYYTPERLTADKVEETVWVGVTKEIEDARLLMGLLVVGKYLSDDLNVLEWLLPLLESKNPKILAVLGVFLTIDKATRYHSIDDAIAKKYMSKPLYMALNMIPIKTRIAQKNDLGKRTRKKLNYMIAYEALEKSYKIDKNFLAGYRLGRLYQDGWGVNQSTAKALAFFHDVVNRGAPVGHFHLGLIYSELTEIGNEVKGFIKDEKKSIEFFEQAVAYGNEIGKQVLAEIYLDKKFGYYDEFRGIKYYCEIPIKERPKRTIYSKQRIRINCDTKTMEN